MSKVAYNYGHYIFSVKYCKNTEEQKNENQKSLAVLPSKNCC